MRTYFAYLLSACFIIVLSFLAPEKAFSQANPGENKAPGTDSNPANPSAHATYVSGITPGRARALIGVAVGLISLAVGWGAKARAASGKGNARNRAILAITLGIVGIILSIIHLCVMAGAVFGSGSGKAGAIFAFIPNLIGIILGGQALRQKTGGG
jgi:hypothetical protein